MSTQSKLSVLPSDNRCPKCKDKRLAEEIQVGVDQRGVFELDYKCNCSCGYKFSKKLSEPTILPTRRQMMQCDSAGRIPPELKA